MVKRKRKSESLETSADSNAELQRLSKNVYGYDKVESELEQQNETAEDLLNEVEDYAIIKLDVKGAIRSWNKGAENIKGYNAKEIIGRNYRIFYTQEDKAAKLSETLLEEARLKGRTNYEGWRVRKDGTRFWGSMTLTALHDKNGNVKGYLKVTRDLTARKTAEDKYSNFVEELRIKNRELKKSEERYHKMVSEVRDYAIILLDNDGRILDWNKGAESLKGYTSNEIVGKNFRLFYPKEEKDNGLPGQLLSEAAKQGSVVHEGWRIKKDGTRFWGNVVITALHDEDNNIIGFSKVTRDLTEKKVAEDKLSNLLEELRQANEELKFSEERHHKMIGEVLDYAIILLDPSGNIQNWNSGVQFIKGYKPGEIIGKNFSVFYTKADQKNGLPRQLLSEAESKGKVSHEGWRVRKDGTQFWGSVVITALHGDDNSIIGFSKVTRDLTDKKKAEDLLKRNAAQLELKTKALERVNGELLAFTYVASHDLKEPLRKIKTFASRIKDVGYSPVRSEEFMEKIIGSANKMQSLIENLLAFSQVSNDESTFETVNLNEVLDSVKNDLELLISEKQAVIKCDKLPVITGVNFQMHQLFLNLISNAIKFAREGEPPYIEIKAQTLKGPEVPTLESDAQSNNYYFITVSDRGIGFPQEHADKIFEAFHRLNKKGPIAGSGIGLAIVKRIVENHNGIISAEGAPGEGAVFNMYFPLDNNH
jgi:PAS domain S-box-containing protein